MNEEAEAPVAWYWGCGLGFAILFMSGIDLLHRNLDSWSSQRIPRVSTHGAWKSKLRTWPVDHIGHRTCGDSL